MKSMKHKHQALIFTILLLLVLLAGVFYIIRTSKVQNKPQGAAQPNNVVTTFDVMPPFASGEIVSVDGDTVKIKGAFEGATATEEINALVTEKTQIFQQIIVDNLPTLAVQKLEDLKPGDQAMFFFSEEDESGVVLTKIQILSKVE